MQDMPSFDPQGVLETLSRLVGEAAEVVVRDGAREIWIFPLSGESPIYLSLPVEEPEACDVYAGFAFRTTVIAEGADDRGDVVAELVGAIAAGRVSEFFDFGDTQGALRVRGREYGSSGIRWSRQWTDNPGTDRAYALPAWAQQPKPLSR